MKNKFIIGIITIATLFLITGGISLVKKFNQENKERENALKYLISSQKQNSFVECGEIKIVTKVERSLADWIYLLDAYSGVLEKNYWQSVVLEPGGYGVGGYEFPADSPSLESQQPIDIDDNGMVDDVIALGVANRKVGDYLVIVEPGRNVDKNSAYGIQLNIDSRDYILAKDVPYSSNALDRVYILRSTETGIIPIVPASVGCREGYK